MGTTGLGFSYPEDEDPAKLQDYLEALWKANGIRWYTPQAIATEENRESTSFGTLTTADEIKSVVLPENGVMLIGYQALWKRTGSAGTINAALFLGANQLKISGGGGPVVQEAGAQGSNFGALATTQTGLRAGVGTTGDSQVTTGQILGLGGTNGFEELANNTLAGFTALFAAAGTYDVSVRFKATAGAKAVAKSRKLWVAVLG